MGYQRDYVVSHPLPIINFFVDIIMVWHGMARYGMDNGVDAGIFGGKEGRTCRLLSGSLRYNKLTRRANPLM